MRKILVILIIIIFCSCNSKKQLNFSIYYWEVISLKEDFQVSPLECMFKLDSVLLDTVIIKSKNCSYSTSKNFTIQIIHRIDSLRRIHNIDTNLRITGFTNDTLVSDISLSSEPVYGDIPYKNYFCYVKENITSKKQILREFNFSTTKDYNIIFASTFFKPNLNYSMVDIPYLYQLRKIEKYSKGRSVFSIKIPRIVIKVNDSCIKEIKNALK